MEYEAVSSPVNRLNPHFCPTCIVSSDDDDDLISEVIYSENGGVTYAVKCNLSENSAADQAEVITVDGLKTYIQLESSPRIHEVQSDPPANDAGFESETEGEEGVSSQECPAITFEISVPVSPAPIPIPMPKQGSSSVKHY